METRTIRDDVQGADIVVHTLGGGPLVLVSHGSGSNVLLLRGLADAIVAAGYSVALVEHPGNKRGDDALANTTANLVNRPRHIKLVLDALGAERAVVIGHSMGGYTALAIAGGEPLALPEQTEDRKAVSLRVVHDARVIGVVLLAPAIPWFMAPGALANVRVPVRVILCERDDLAPPFFAQRILAPLAHAETTIVPNAGHFAFFWPLPPALAASSLPPAQNPEGFDRADYQPQLHANVITFLRQWFGESLIGTLADPAVAAWRLPDGGVLVVTPQGKFVLRPTDTLVHSFGGPGAHMGVVPLGIDRVAADGTRQMLYGEAYDEAISPIDADKFYARMVSFFERVAAAAACAIRAEAD